MLLVDKGWRIDIEEVNDLMSKNGEKILSGATTAFIDSTNKSSAAFITLGGIEPLLISATG